jgi:hypothetical protein
VCAIVCESVCVKAKPSLHKSRVAEKSVNRAPNLQDLLCLTVFIYIIYLPTILLRFRLPGLKYIYLLWEHHTKSIAEFSYSLLRGSDFSLQISLPGVIPTLPPRKRNLACARCRQQKIRCGNQYPSCSNCIKARVACIKPTTTDSEASRQ